MGVDIEAVVRSKSEKLWRFTPRFVFNLLRGIIHEKELNYCLKEFGSQPPFEFISNTLSYMGVGCSIEGLDKIPQGRYIFASNHPLGGFDGLMIAQMVAQKFSDAKIVVNDILMNVEPLAPIFIPVNKHGRQNSRYAALFNEAFQSDSQIVTFPAGLCSRRKSGVVHDLPWSPQFVKQAIKTKRDIVPLYFDGELSNFFYNLSNIRQKLRIKANIEMLFLVDEMIKQKGKVFRIIVGDPIPWQSLESAKSHRTIANQICIKTYNLNK